MMETCCHASVLDCINECYSGSKTWLKHTVQWKMMYVCSLLEMSVYI